MNSALTSARKAYAQARPFAATILLGAAALTIVLTGARAIADIVGPVFRSGQPPSCCCLPPTWCWASSPSPS
jgi:hypothetical protein